MPRHGLGQLLEPIQSYCIIEQLEPVTSLVVSDKTGLPGQGFIAAQDVPAAQARVFDIDWLAMTPPDPDVLEAAADRLPSNGRSLDELRHEIGAS